MTLIHAVSDDAGSLQVLDKDAISAAEVSFLRRSDDGTVLYRSVKVDGQLGLALQTGHGTSEIEVHDSNVLLGFASRETLLGFVAIHARSRDLEQFPHSRLARALHHLVNDHHVQLSEQQIAKLCDQMF